MKSIMTAVTLLVSACVCIGQTNVKPDKRVKAEMSRVHSDMRLLCRKADAAISNYNEAVHERSEIAKRVNISRGDSDRMHKLSMLSDAAFQRMITIAKDWTEYARNNSALVSIDDSARLKSFCDGIDELTALKKKDSEDMKEMRQERAVWAQERQASAQERQANAQERQANAQENLVRKIAY